MNTVEAMDGRISPRLEEPVNKGRRSAVPEMISNGDVKGDGRFKVAVSSFIATVDKQVDGCFV